MLQLIYHPVRSSKPLKVDSKSAVPFSFHSLVEQHKAQSSSQDKASLERDGASNFLPELREALPERLSKNLRNFNHQYLGKNHASDFGIPTVFVRSIREFLNTYHTQGVLNANETLKEWNRAEHLSRIFLKVFTCQVSGFHYLQLKEEPNLEVKHKNLQVVSFEKLVWAFPDSSEPISLPFSCEISPEWAIPTIAQVAILTLDGDSDFMPSFQYLTSYFNRTVMDSTDSFSVDVPTLDGSVVTLKLRASDFGVVRSTTVFKNLCSTPEPAADLGFVEGWFGLPGLRLVNYCKYVQAQDMRARLGIVSGSSGIGKSFLVSRIANALGISCHIIHSADLSLEEVHSVSKEPALLVLDNVHEFYGRKADAIDVLELLNVTKQMPKLLVLALTSCPGEIHASLISKVEFHIELEPPTNAQRRTILGDFLAPTCSLDASLLDRISEACPGFLMADLYTLVTATLAKSPPLLENFLASKRLVHQPHSLPQPQKIPPVFFSQIGGLEKAKAVLKRLSFRLFGPSSNIVGGKGALMYGPPGTGKTLLGKALATEASANFLPVRIPDLIRGEIGASEKALSRLFAEARSSSPCIMFLDELDALFVNRASSTSTHGSRLVAQFILELDGLDNSVLVLATTNHPLAIDRSVLRPGRIDHHIYLPPPSPQERLDIFKILIPGLADEYALLEQLTVLTDGFTGADLSALKHRAQVLAYHRSPDTPITCKDVLDTLSPGAPCPLIPSVSDSHLEEFRIFQNPC